MNFLVSAPDPNQPQHGLHWKQSVLGLVWSGGWFGSGVRLGLGPGWVWSQVGSGAKTVNFQDDTPHNDNFLLVESE